ncbi:DUF1127 domain-containing protein [Modicisalibacter sp. MOD 31.J]|uniref:DUF1127 domain-containing protein n=1 Tax=Modicisalibacter sp. MOD 31.J TaxID=2831897 RepID=UPI001CCB33F4|nr:DUF1127 domain-containing protein [Modicisalibacter sp. MOD 31.J]MBZ9559386.1 DUF1127 domain-containing protein [Modicisalibacter sp. R2A 31.J]MBZ9576449.1 DUF1127 domain-containing protein [Modicisalibacter sp. MOD 31.J]
MSRPLSRLFARLLRQSRRHHSRHGLLDLDDRQLRDIGLTRDEARREGTKRFWQ